MVRKVSDSLVEISNAMKNAEAKPSAKDLQDVKNLLKGLGKEEADKLLKVKCAFDKVAKLGILSKGMLTLLALFALKGMSFAGANDSTSVDIDKMLSALTAPEKVKLERIERDMGKELEKAKMQEEDLLTKDISKTPDYSKQPKRERPKNYPGVDIK